MPAWGREAEFMRLLGSQIKKMTKDGLDTLVYIAIKDMSECYKAVPALVLHFMKKTSKDGPGRLHVLRIMDAILGKSLQKNKLNDKFVARIESAKVAQSLLQYVSECSAEQRAKASKIVQTWRTHRVFSPPTIAAVEDALGYEEVQMSGSPRAEETLPSKVTSPVEAGAARPGTTATGSGTMPLPFSPGEATTPNTTVPHTSAHQDNVSAPADSIDDPVHTIPSNGAAVPPSPDAYRALSRKLSLPAHPPLPEDGVDPFAKGVDAVVLSSGATLTNPSLGTGKPQRQSKFDQPARTANDEVPPTPPPGAPPLPPEPPNPTDSTTPHTVIHPHHHRSQSSTHTSLPGPPPGIPQFPTPNTPTQPPPQPSTVYTTSTTTPPLPFINSLPPQPHTAPVPGIPAPVAQQAATNFTLPLPRSTTTTSHPLVLATPGPAMTLPQPKALAAATILSKPTADQAPAAQAPQTGASAPMATAPASIEVLPPPFFGEVWTPKPSDVKSATPSQATPPGVQPLSPHVATCAPAILSQPAISQPGHQWPPDPQMNGSIITPPPAYAPVRYAAKPHAPTMSGQPFLPPKPNAFVPGFQHGGMSGPLAAPNQFAAPYNPFTVPDTLPPVPPTNTVQPPHQLGPTHHMHPQMSNPVAPQPAPRPLANGSIMRPPWEPAPTTSQPPLVGGGPPPNGTFPRQDVVSTGVTTTGLERGLPGPPQLQQPCLDKSHHNQRKDASASAPPDGDRYQSSQGKHTDDDLPPPPPARAPPGGGSPTADLPHNSQSTDQVTNGEDGAKGEDGLTGELDNGAVPGQKRRRSRWDE